MPKKKKKIKSSLLWTARARKIRKKGVQTCEECGETYKLTFFFVYLSCKRQRMYSRRCHNCCGHFRGRDSRY
jgi:hypothetical protein